MGWKRYEDIRNSPIVRKILKMRRKESMKEKLGALIKSKLLLWCAMIGSLLPIIAVAYYNRQNADDYTYTVITHAAVMNHDNIFAAAVQSVKYFMENWNGLYFSTFLQSLSWGIYGSKFCILNTIVIILSLIIGIGMLSYTVIRRILQLEEVDWKLLAGMIFVYIMQTFPSPVQALYWYNGAVNYTFMWSLFLLTLSFLLLYMFDKDSKYPNMIYIVCLVLTLLTIGGNHVVQGLLLGFTFLFSIFALRKKYKREIIVPFIIAFAGFAFNMMSGGTESRWESMEYDHNIIKTIISSAATTVQWGIQWFTLSTLLLVIAVMILLKPAIRKYGKNYEWNIGHVIAEFLFSILIIFCMNFIPTFAMGYAGSGRVTNIIYATFVVLMIVNAFILSCYLFKRFHNLKLEESISEMQGRILDNLQKGMLLLAVCYVALFGMGTCIRMPYGSTAVNALKDIVSGDAKTYAAELDAREAYYAEHQGEDVTVEALSCYPYTLCFTDIEMDQEDYKNTYSAEFYGVKSITRLPDANGE